MRPPFAPRRRLAVLFVAGVGVLLEAVLLSQSARAPLRTPFVPRAGRAAPASAPLEGREARQGRSVFRLELLAHDPVSLLAHEELQLYLDAGSTRRPLKRATLQLRGSGCTLAAAPSESLTSREATVFRRSTECPAALAAGTPAVIDLAAEVDGSGEVTLLAFEATADVPAPLQVAPERGLPLDVRGAFVDYPKTAPRMALLNAMWRLGEGPVWLTLLVGLATVLGCLGCLVFPTGATMRRKAGRGAAAAALLAASLGLLYAVLAPPLSGPDEPYHLLGFAELVHDQPLAKDTVAWMAETHLWRIRQQPGERFRTIDVGRPYLAEDDQLRATEVAMRSALLGRLWRLAGPWLPGGGSAPRTLLSLRVLNVLLFALAVGTSAALAINLVAERYPQWLVFPFFFVPALPFFAMHVSETAVLCAVYVLLAASVAVLFLDGPRAEWAGTPLGLSTGLMLAGGRSPWPLVLLVIAVLLARVVLGSRETPSRPRAALVFWSGFGAGVAVLFVVLDEAYRLMTETYALQLATFVPPRLRTLVVWLLAHPVAILALVLFGAALEVAAYPLRIRLATRFERSARRVAGWGAGVAAVAISLSLACSLFVSYPTLPFEWTHPLAAPDRVSVTLRSMATALRLTGSDYLLASTFWVGFGWLDTMPGPAFQALLTLLVGVALVMLFVELARRKDVRRLAWLVVFAAGAAVSLAGYALATQDRPTTLVGRYLIGWYLAWLCVTAGALTLDRSRLDGADRSSHGAWRAAVLLVVAGSVHAYCLTFILRRYF
jgi:hypothetical protein